MYIFLVVQLYEFHHNNKSLFELLIFFTKQPTLLLKPYTTEHKLSEVKQTCWSSLWWVMANMYLASWEMLIAEMNSSFVPSTTSNIVWTGMLFAHNGVKKWYLDYLSQHCLFKLFNENLKVSICFTRILKCTTLNFIQHRRLT